MLQRRASRKQKRSKNWEKSQTNVARLHHQIANTHKNFHLQIAHQLCDQAEIIFVEDIDFRVSAKGFLGKQMLDGAFGQFRTLLQSVCWKRGKYLAQLEHRFTCQICFNCNSHTGKKDLSVPELCPECGYRTTRDRASAQVIKLRGESSIVPSDAGELKLPTDCVQWGLIRLAKCNVGMSQFRLRHSYTVIFRSAAGRTSLNTESSVEIISISTTKNLVFLGIVRVFRILRLVSI